MKTLFPKTNCLALLSAVLLAGCGAKDPSTTAPRECPAGSIPDPSPYPAGTYLLLAEDTLNHTEGYLTQAGDTAVPFGRYQKCFTDTFRSYAMVVSQADGLVAIDRSGQVLYRGFVFDNGPDDPSEGLFRVKDVCDRIGYADHLTGQVVIPPGYSCAGPFEGGRAKVAATCQHIKEGEYTRWESQDWYQIDRTGRRAD